MSYIEIILPFAPIFVLAAALVYVAVFMALKRKREKPGLLTMFAEYMLIGWFVVFIYVTQLMPFGNGMGDLFNIQPLHMFYIAFRYGSNNAGMVWQFLLNILMFVPLGFLLPIVFSRKCALWHRVLLVSFCTTLTTELIQLITKRGTDIDDVIANTAGGLCGFALFAILCALIGLIKRRKTDIPHMGRNMVISAVVLLAVAAPFVAVIITDGLSEYGNLYYGHNQPRYIEIEGNISKEATTRAVYKYAPHTDLAVLQKKLVEASGFNGQFVQDSYGGWKLSVGENGFISISRNLTWSINYPSRIDYTPTSVIVLNEDEALIRAWFYLDQFGVTPESVRYEAAQSRFDSDEYNLVFSNIVSRENQIIVGGVSIFLTVDGELMYISDGRIWGEYVRDVNCISPFESIGIAQDIGNIVWNGTAHISSVESDYVLIDKTGYIIPAWKINAYFISESDNKYDWFPLIDAVK